MNTLLVSVNGVALEEVDYTPGIFLDSAMALLCNHEILDDDEQPPNLSVVERGQYRRMGCF